ncbi:putative integral membrane protein [Cryptosporidium felis]|nr:putative integral membrane protein [Cryptosporidium felis]
MEKGDYHNLNGRFGPNIGNKHESDISDSLELIWVNGKDENSLGEGLDDSPSKYEKWATTKNTSNGELTEYKVEIIQRRTSKSLLRVRYWHDKVHVALFILGLFGISVIPWSLSWIIGKTCMKPKMHRGKKLRQLNGTLALIFIFFPALFGYLYYQSLAFASYDTNSIFMATLEENTSSGKSGTSSTQISSSLENSAQLNPPRPQILSCTSDFNLEILYWKQDQSVEKGLVLFIGKLVSDLWSKSKALEEAYRNGFTVLVITPPGYGKSEKIVNSNNQPQLTKISNSSFLFWIITDCLKYDTRRVVVVTHSNSITQKYVIPLIMSYPVAGIVFFNTNMGIKWFNALNPVINDHFYYRPMNFNETIVRYIGDRKPLETKISVDGKPESKESGNATWQEKVNKKHISNKIDGVINNSNLNSNKATSTKTSIPSITTKSVNENKEKLELSTKKYPDDNSKISQEELENEEEESEDNQETEQIIDESSQENMENSEISDEVNGFLESISTDNFKKENSNNYNKEEVSMKVNTNQNTGKNSTSITTTKKPVERTTNSTMTNLTTKNPTNNTINANNPTEKPRNSTNTDITTKKPITKPSNTTSTHKTNVATKKPVSKPANSTNIHTTTKKPTSNLTTTKKPISKPTNSTSIHTNTKKPTNNLTTTKKPISKPTNSTSIHTTTKKPKNNLTTTKSPVATSSTTKKPLNKPATTTRPAVITTAKNPPPKTTATTTNKTIKINSTSTRKPVTTTTTKRQVAKTTATTKKTVTMTTTKKIVTKLTTKSVAMKNQQKQKQYLHAQSLQKKRFLASKTAFTDKNYDKGVSNMKAVVENCIAPNFTYKYDNRWHITEQNKMGPFGWFDGKYTIPGWRTMQMAYESFDFDDLDAQKLKNGTYILTVEYFSSLIQTLSQILPLIAQRIAFSKVQNTTDNTDDSQTNSNQKDKYAHDAPSTWNKNRQNAYLKYRSNFELVPAEEIYCTN